MSKSGKKGFDAFKFRTDEEIAALTPLARQRYLDDKTKAIAGGHDGLEMGDEVEADEEYEAEEDGDYGENHFEGGDDEDEDDGGGLHEGEWYSRLSLGLH